MTMLRFIGGPWDDTERELEPVETGDATIEAFYTDDPGAGFYKCRDGATVPVDGALEVIWHPSVLRG
jgi:hypothetical protein